MPIVVLVLNFVEKHHKNMANCIVEVGKNVRHQNLALSPKPQKPMTFFFVKMGRMAICGEALCWPKIILKKN